MRDECTGIPSLDAGPLPERPDSLDGPFHGDWTLEVRRIGLRPAHEFHQPLGLFGSHCGYTLVKCPGIPISRAEVYTVAKVAHFHHPRAHAEDEHTFFLVLCAEFGDNDVQGGLGGRVQGGILNVEIVDEVKVGMTAGDGDDLLGLALQYKRHEKVEEVDVTGDIGLEQFVCNVVELLGLFASVEQTSLTSNSNQREVDLQFTNR